VIDDASVDAERCAGCGLAVAGGTAGCQSIMDEVLALHFSDATYFSVHRLFVDAYCLQHPDAYCVSFKSLAAHLAHLCWSLEYAGSRAIPSEPIRRWVERHPHLAKPPLPAFRGELTVADVARVTSPAEHHDVVVHWAESTWVAYAALQAIARQWVQFALDENTDPRTRQSSRQ
jgi:hypothetical protein